MQFHLSFQRAKPATATLKALDTGVPVDSGNNARGPILKTDDHVLFLKSRTQDGWPIQRLIIAATYVGAGAAIAMNVKVYIFDKNLGQWILLPGSATTVTPTKVATPPTDVVPTYIDLPVLADASQVQADLPSPRLGEIAACVVFSDPGAAPNGTYTVSVGAILSTKSY